MELVEGKLKSSKLAVVSETVSKGKAFLDEHNGKVLTVIASRDLLELEAESQSLLKSIVEPDRQVKSPSTLDVIGTQFRRKEPFEVLGAAEKFLHYHDLDSPDTFFSSSEELHLLHTYIERVLREDPVDSKEPPLEQHHAMFHLIPLHDHATKMHLWNTFKWSIFPSNLTLANAMEAYFGAKVALYFAWLHFFTVFLAGPAVVGGALALYESVFVADASGDSMIAPFFTLLMVVWSACFVQFWARRSATLVCGWGVVESTSFSRRPEFQGLVHVNVFSGERGVTYPYYRRLYKYAVSASMTGGMLVAAFCLMVVSLNFQGYIHDDSVLGSYLHLPWVHQFSLPGAVFDQQGGGPYPWLLPYIPTITHASCIMFLNLKYRAVAGMLTDWENHKTVDAYEDALVLKRFLFEAFDCYIALFYLAFCQLDVVLLQKELVSLYTLDTIRRVGIETILPLVLRWYNDRVDSSMKKGDSNKPNGDDENVSAATLQLVEQVTGFDEYEPFDDYMEKVIEFGYIVLFSSCFPLAALLSVVSNLVELKADQFKLIFVHQRPRVHRVGSVGIWQTIVTGLVWLSVLTNVFLFGFTTEQMMIWLPSYFAIQHVDDAIFGGVDHIHVAAKGRETAVLGLVFFLEHVAFFVVQSIFSFIPTVPDSVAEENARRQRVLLRKKNKHVIQAPSATLQTVA
ncbi:hypothetical protein DYB37_010642 [Aphanomyces astaci]|uniref:Anoctamin transmembrane domain-containing protein n=1 Tax=Aphanomyces astaci TaxID=112090 RepID=A0A3R7AEF0_APHAT|nr:hypothetical protein DYB35_011428 [Aphanomyces astaci]RHZ16323.1 hypothetical protein DYB37_010642 [Aphanomyces astaci]